MLYIPPGYYEAAYEHSLAGSLHVSVVTCGWRYTGVDFPTDAPNLLAAWSNHPVTTMADVWTYVGGRLRDASGTVLDVPASVGGGVAHTPTTPNVTFLYRKTTGLGGRKNRGRMYVPGVSEQDVDGVGDVVGSKITEIDGQIGAWIGASADANFSPYILHNISVADPTPAPTLINTVFVDPLAATQRRRMRA